MNKLRVNIFFFTVLLLIAACDSKPRVIEASSEEEGTMSATSLPVFKELSNNHEDHQHNHPAATSAGEHEVVVQEILNTDKYNYLKVQEQDKSFWIAISKRDIKKGETYFYRGGLLKRNFFSREFNRVFETIYLVSNLWQKTQTTPTASTAKINSGESLPDLKVEKIKPAEGSISLAQLFSDKGKYNNTVVKITGKCVKVNPKIMNRNWLHIQDGSGDGLDLTVTTAEVVSPGAIVSLEGTIALDKDFGAGYRYDIILEGAVLK